MQLDGVGATGVNCSSVFRFSESIHFLCCVDQGDPNIGGKSVLFSLQRMTIKNGFRQGKRPCEIDAAMKKFGPCAFESSKAWMALL